MLQLPNVQNPHIHIIGTGGTGGFAAEYLVRLFASSDQRVTIELYDGDTVEAKNLKRQNFVVDDLDKKKVTALANRLSQQVLTPPTIVEHEDYIIDAEEFMAELLMTTEDDETLIIVLAVDNIATRRLINESIDMLSETLPVIALDSGNDNQGGQVVLYTNTPVVQTNIMGKHEEIVLPTMLQLYPEIDIIKDERDENPGIVSYCAEESESKPQAMMANVRNGEIIASVVYSVSQNNPQPYNCWTSNILANQSVGSFTLGKEDN